MSERMILNVGVLWDMKWREVYCEPSVDGIVGIVVIVVE